MPLAPPVTTATRPSFGACFVFHAVVLLDNHPTQPGGRGVGFEYVSVEEAIGRDGLRMVVVGGVPSPWGEAAKGLFHIEGIDWVGVRLAYDSEALLQWAGERSGPVAVYDKEAPRPGWREILLLAERLAPAPRLLPAGPEAREQVLSLAGTICDKGGLNWTRRLQLVHAGLQGLPGFNARASTYLAKKYGHDPKAAPRPARKWSRCWARSRRA